MIGMASFDRRTKRQRESDGPLARYLGELQAEVLEVFLQRDSATVREAVEEMNERRKRKLAYTTVLTLVSRLYGRGFLAREAEGRGFRYWAVKDREGLLGDLSDQLIDRLLADFGDIAVARLGERLGDLDPDLLKKLKAAGETS
jgi:predicted transcriptional regulator